MSTSTEVNATISQCTSLVRIACCSIRKIDLEDLIWSLLEGEVTFFGRVVSIELSSYMVVLQRKDASLILDTTPAFSKKV